MKIPWRHLESEPLRVELEDIFLIVANLDDADAKTINKLVRSQSKNNIVSALESEIRPGSEGGWDGRTKMTHLVCVLQIKTVAASQQRRQEAGNRKRRKIPYKPEQSKAEQG